MTLRLQNLMLAMLLALTTLFVGFGTLSQNPTSGGYQLFERAASGISADIQLASLGNFAPSPETASEYANATNTGAIPDGWRPISGVGANIPTPRGFTSYRTPNGDIVHVSPGGLKYGKDNNFGNRVNHVLDHTSPNPGKPKHTVFNAQGDDALALVDEAWTKKGSPVPNDPGAYVVPMGRTVGTTGETSIRVIVKPGTNEIISAYPY